MNELSELDELGNRQSWVIVCLVDNKAIFETWSVQTARAINREKYRAIPIREYLASLNK